MSPPQAQAVKPGDITTILYNILYKGEVKNVGDLFGLGPSLCFLLLESSKQRKSGKSRCSQVLLDPSAKKRTHDAFPDRKRTLCERKQLQQILLVLLLEILL